MNYELAKELKEAGFQQNTNNPEGFVEDVSNTDEMGMYLVAYAPTLSELIEACGDNVALFKWKNSWNAVETTNIETGFDYCGLRVMITPNGGHGDTPEEAVARLWLALNKKSDLQVVKNFIEYAESEEGKKAGWQSI